MLKLFAPDYGKKLWPSRGGQAAARSRSICLNQPAIWFQLAKFTVTTQAKSTDYTD
jgi:hypothetical protein